MANPLHPAMAMAKRKNKKKHVLNLQPGMDATLLIGEVSEFGLGSFNVWSYKTGDGSSS